MCGKSPLVKQREHLHDAIIGRCGTRARARRHGQRVRRRDVRRFAHGARTDARPCAEGGGAFGRADRRPVRRKSLGRRFPADARRPVGARPAGNGRPAQEVLEQAAKVVLPFVARLDHARFFGFVPSSPTWPACSPTSWLPGTTSMHAPGWSQAVRAHSNWSSSTGGDAGSAIPSARAGCSRAEARRRASMPSSRPAKRRAIRSARPCT